MEQWYALNSKPHQEGRVAEYLRQRRVEAYLPLVRVNPVNPRAARIRPYFPGYLFARLDVEAAGLGACQWTPGLRGVVQFGGLPGTVPDAFIGELRRRLAQIGAAGGLTFDNLQRGDAVRIVSGPLAGYEAVFDMRLASSDRVRVLLEAMRQGRLSERQSAPEKRYGASENRCGPMRNVIPVELDAGCIRKLA